MRIQDIQKESVALVVTSPPYPMIKKWDELFGGEEQLDFGKQHKQLHQVWEECWRVLIPGGICCINIGDATRSINKNFQCYANYAKMMVDCIEIGFTPLIPIFWRKISNRPNAFLGSGFTPPNAYVAQDCEYIAIFRKGTLRRFSIEEKEKEKAKQSRFTKVERDLWFQQIWNVPGKRGAKETSAFPDEIPRRLIRMFSIIDDIVLDPFQGTGTTENVAIPLQRQFIGDDFFVHR